MKYLFGYGSLLSPTSAARTLRRSLDVGELRPTTVLGFRRTWTAAAEVSVTLEDSIRRETALFLDLSAAPGQACNGVLLEVSEAELARLDLRERQYDRISVQASLEGALVPAFVYVTPLAAKTTRGGVLEGYLDIIHSALALYPPTFNDAFWRTTDPCPTPLIKGTYSFLDPDQNQAAGRK